MPATKETIFVLPPADFDNPLILCAAGITHPDRRYRVRRECEDLTVLEYIVSGKGHLRVEGNSCEVNAGDVYLIHPYTHHEYHADWENPWEKIWFNLRGPLVKSLIEVYRLTDAVHFPACPLEQEFRDALETARTRPADSYTQLSLALHRIFAGLNRWRQQHPETRKSPEGLKLKTHLDRHWRRSVPLEELAKLIGRSRSQVMRIFQHDWNTTPCQYIQQQRLDLAKQYLENTEAKISQIAEFVGFRDEFYFSNWFKEKTGVSPLFYRREKQ